ncbi:flagellin domain-containing protein [Nitrospirillum viridazoti Y2]|uniref:Flagellin-like hook-associated protein FlgL n=1 Tax=Nitrospirillum amazonense TaxID=28077 RepID=A0A560IKT6_9PROT|nr:flagellin [Nitrospirillum amazonense]EGY02746.1 flagellin domain-containing protein [Nitrospirillum amazonense Y2]TWB58669.1 flagellin-like hook-associated protein FlgL [Nitrospirillum amazonense]
MSSQVALSSAMRSNLLLLQNTNSSIDKLQSQLSTGNKVNSALDGPTAFFAAQGLNQRASDLSTLKDAMGQAISTIKAGNQGITSIQKLIDQAKGLTTSAYSNLGNDPSAIATRKSLAAQFNDIKDQIDKLAADSGYGGKNLLAGSGQTFDATSSSRSTVNSITGLSNSRVTNVTTSDTYSIRVAGTGDISGNAGDIASAEDARGLFGLKVSGKLSSTAGNFSDVSIEIRGAVGQTRTAVITEGGESRSITFFDNTQSATNSLVSAGTSGTQQISQVNITGNIDEGDTFNVTINGRTFSYTASAGDVSNPSPTTRQATIATNLQNLITNSISIPGSAISGFSVSSSTPGTFQITAASSYGTSNSFTLGSSTVNALTKDISVSFTSGSVVSFTVDRSTLEGLGTAGNGTSTIEKDVDLSVTATDLNGVSITRSGANDRGSGKLTDGENAMSFTTGTVRINVDSTKIMQAASANRSANMTTSQQTPANTQNDLSVQFNETNTNSLSVKSTNVTTDGQGLRLDYAQNDFLDRSDIDAAVAQLTYATTQLRSAGQTLSTNLNVIQTRSDFTDAFNNVLSDGADSLVQVDQNQAGAELLTLQTRQSLGVTTLSLANQSQQAILKLF